MNISGRTEGFLNYIDTEDLTKGKDSSVYSESSDPSSITPSSSPRELENADQSQTAKEPQTSQRNIFSRQRCIQIGVTALAVLLSPLLLTIALPIMSQINQLSRLGNKGHSLLDNLMSKLVLPSVSLEKIPVPKDIPQFSVTTKDGVKIEGMALMAKQPSDPPKCAVLFCNNGNQMMFSDMQYKAKQYQEKGFNVILFDFRGVAGNGPPPQKCKDLCLDGEAVVDALLADGLNMTDQEGNAINLRTTADQVILDGHSIGGSVATYVGSKYPSTTLVADRTFTKWSDAAEKLVSAYSNPVIAKIVKFCFLSSRKTEMDTAGNMRKRLSDQNHTVTIIEEAVYDKVVKGSAKLTLDKVENLMKGDKSYGVLVGQSFAKQKFDDTLHDHTTYKYMKERTELLNTINARFRSV